MKPAWCSGGAESTNGSTNNKFTLLYAPHARHNSNTPHVRVRQAISIACPLGMVLLKGGSKDTPKPTPKHKMNTGYCYLCTATLVLTLSYHCSTFFEPKKASIPGITIVATARAAALVLSDHPIS